MTTPLGPLTATPMPDTSPPSVTLEVSDGTLGTSNVTIVRMDPDGRWHPVRGAEPAHVIDGAWSGFDDEAPYGVPVSYQMTRTSGAVDTGRSPLAGGGYANTLQLDVTDVWLIHPGVPSLSQRLELRDWQPIVRAARRGVFVPLGGGLPLVVSGARAAGTSQLETLTSTTEDEDGLRALLDDGSPLLLNVPVTLGWNAPSGWVSVGDSTTAREFMWGPAPRRVWTLPYNEVARPIGSTQSLWTCAGLLAEQATCADVLTHYETCATLAAHRPV